MSEITTCLNAAVELSRQQKPMVLIVDQIHEALTLLAAKVEALEKRGPDMVAVGTNVPYLKELCERVEKMLAPASDSEIAQWGNNLVARITEAARQKPEPTPTQEQNLTVAEARSQNVCRICRKPVSAPFNLSYGAEFAHESCLLQAHASPKRKEQSLLSRIQSYLENGGVFNPEMMEHDKVRDLLIDCREALLPKESK